MFFVFGGFLGIVVGIIQVIGKCFKLRSLNKIMH